MRYDFSQITAEGEEVAQMVESMTDSELKKVSGLIKQMKQEEKQQEQQDYMEFVRNTILPLVHKYGEKTQAVLDIKEETDGGILVELSSRVGFGAQELDRWTKLIFVTAQDIWIDAEDGAVQMHLLYSVRRDYEDIEC